MEASADAVHEVRRALVAIALAALLAACGLSVQGTAVTTGEVSPGTEAGVDASSTDTDGSAPRDLDGGPVNPRPAPVTSCFKTNSCESTGSCMFEGCAKDDNRHWPTRVGAVDNTEECTGGGGICDFFDGNCQSQTGGYMQSTLTVPAADNFRFDAQISLGDVDTSVTVFELSTTGRTLSIVNNGGRLQLCRSAMGTLPAACVGSVRPSSAKLYVHGFMSKVSPAGSAVLTQFEEPVFESSRCVERGTLDLEGPFIEAIVTAKAGCVTGTCSGSNELVWDDARFMLAPR